MKNQTLNRPRSFVVGDDINYLSDRKKGFQQTEHPGASKLLNKTIQRDCACFLLWKTALVKDKFQLSLLTYIARWSKMAVERSKKSKSGNVLVPAALRT